MTAKPILHKFINWHDGDVRELTLYTDSGEEIITVSDEHPFWVIGKGWTDASDLTAYSQVLTLDNRIQLVKSNTRYDQTMVMCNFEIADYHTYAVTDDAVWVHNYEVGNGEIKMADFITLMASLIKMVTLKNGESLKILQQGIVKKNLILEA